MLRDFWKTATLLLVCSIATGAYVQVTKNPVGTVIAFSGPTCPVGYVPADGSSSLRTGTNAALFAATGCANGCADGTHFNRIDMRGLVPRGDVSGMGNVLITAVSLNNATVAGHGFNHSGVPVQVTGSPPSGLSNGVTYFAIFVDANTIAFADTQAHAISGTKISIAGGVGATVVQWQDPDSGARVAAAPGGNASGPGSFQFDMLVAHSHGLNQSINARTGFQSGGNSPAYETGSGLGNIGITASGGSETRMKNVAIHYCVQI